MAGGLLWASTVRPSDRAALRLISAAPRLREVDLPSEWCVAMRYLNITSNGRRWIANLQSNIFRAERGLSLSGPQR
jgi:hypothetical protein